MGFTLVDSMLFGQVRVIC